MIVPFFNVERYIADCLNSLQEQSYDDFEIILIDDGSTDSSLELAENFRRDCSKCTLWRSDFNRGLGASRNKGVELANGEFVCFVDADDVVSPDFLANLRDCQETTGANIVTGQVMRMSESGEIVDTPVIGDVPPVNPPLTLHERVLGLVNPSVACARLYKSELFEDGANSFRSSIPHEDLFFTYKILRNRKEASAKQGAYLWRQRSDSLSAWVTKAHVDVWYDLKRDTNLYLTINQGSNREFALASRRNIMFVNGVLQKAEEQRRVEVLEYVNYLMQRYGSIMMDDYHRVRGSEIDKVYLPRKLEEYLGELGFA